MTNRILGFTMAFMFVLIGSVLVIIRQIWLNATIVVFQIESF